MAKVKRVGFNFFRPLTQSKKGEVLRVNLKPVLDLLRKKYEEGKEEKDKKEEWKHVYDYNGEPARLSDITEDPGTGFFHLIFERLDYVLPNYTTLHGESKALELQDDEYIGREVSVLYDHEDHILMIQRNRDSLGPLGIELFLRTLLNASKTVNNFEMAIISDTSAKKRAFNQSSYRKFHLKITGVAADGLVEKLYGHKSEGVDSVEIAFSTSSKKKDKLDDGFSKNILDEYIDHKDVKKFQIRAREEEDSIVEPIDLIDHKMQTYTEFRFEKDRTLNPISVFEEMIRIYTLEERGGFKKKIIRM